jgi:hypothetical protein
MCLDADGLSYDEYMLVSTTYCDPGKLSQQWSFTTAGELINKWWGMCLTLPEGDLHHKETPLKLSTCDPSGKNYQAIAIDNSLSEDTTKEDHDYKLFRFMGTDLCIDGTATPGNNEKVYVGNCGSRNVAPLAWKINEDVVVDADGNSISDFKAGYKKLVSGSSADFTYSISNSYSSTETQSASMSLTIGSELTAKIPGLGEAKASMSMSITVATSWT